VVETGTSGRGQVESWGELGGSMTLRGLDAWIEGDHVCSYCGQRFCVCERLEEEGDGENTKMMFCHVDGGENPEDRDKDPFEALLAICRVCGLDYDIRQSESGKWACTLTTILDWPADFFGGVGSQGGRRKFCACNCGSKLEALNSTLPMVFSSLHKSCTAWREIAKTHPDHLQWFVRDSEKREG
jgi:hypothetical protein